MVGYLDYSLFMVISYADIFICSVANLLLRYNRPNRCAKTNFHLFEFQRRFQKSSHENMSFTVGKKE